MDPSPVFIVPEANGVHLCEPVPGASADSAASNVDDERASSRNLKDIQSLKGLIAPNFIKTGVILKEDVLDFLDPASWHQRTRGNFQDLRGAALCAMIVCCGATIKELNRIECSHWLPGGRGEVDLPGGARHQARTVPVVAIAKITINRYNQKVMRAPGVKNLFVGNAGRPLNLDSIYYQFKRMVLRNEIPVVSLMTALHQAFESWVDMDNGPVMRALTGRSSSKWAPPDPKVSIEQMRRVLERAHPLGKLKREMLRWEGPYARLFPNPHFPTLSRQGRVELDFALKIGKGASYGVEMRDAVRTAFESGKCVREIAAHYGVHEAFVQVARDGKKPDRKLTLRVRPLQLSMLQRMRSNPPLLEKEVCEWAQKEHGINLKPAHVYQFARKHGITLKRPQSILVDHEQELRGLVAANPEITYCEIVSWLTKRGLRVSKGRLKRAMILSGIVKTSKIEMLISQKQEMRDLVAANPAITYAEIASSLNKRGLRVKGNYVRCAMIRAGIGKMATRRKSTILIGHEQEVRDLVAANPEITYGEIVSWLTKRGLRISEHGVRLAMIRAGIGKMASRRKSMILMDHEQ